MDIYPPLRSYDHPRTIAETRALIAATAERLRAGGAVVVWGPQDFSDEARREFARHGLKQLETFERDGTWETELDPPYTSLRNR